MAKTTLFDEIGWMDDPAPRDAALNMAIDECLLAGLAATPLLRVYRWSEPAVSIGYFEPMYAAQTAFPGRPIVRRWTGGGIVEHGSDLTYSLLVPRSLPPADWRGGGAYHAIHSAVARALQTAGLEHVTLTGGAPSGPSAPDSIHSHECFENPVTHDVLLNGRKIAGAAQRRTRYGLLHQGSIQTQDGDGTEKPALRPGTRLYAVVLAQLPLATGGRVHARPLTAAEMERAVNLAAARYGAPDWRDKF